MQDHYENQDAGKRHPDPETIAAYRREFLAGEETERIQEHLVSCGECLDLLLLEDDEIEEQSGVLNFEKEMIWARLKAARAEDDRRAAQSRTAKALAAAAVLLAVVVPLGGVGFHQSHVITELTRPQLNISIHDVLENGHRGIERRTRGADESGLEPMAFEIPPGTEYYTVIFPVEADQESIYDVEIVDDRQELVWEGQGLEVDELGYATLGLSRRFLDAGSYRIRVFHRGRGPNPVRDHPIVIRYL